MGLGLHDRYSALEGFTVAFEHLNTAPQPDSFAVVLASGLIPRFLWPEKPFSTYSDRFTGWASGMRASMFFPSMPGELVLHFGYIGGLIAMGVLGIGWRTLFTYCVALNNATLGFAYLVLASQAVTQLEVGFVVSYGALLRDATISLFVISRRPGAPKGPSGLRAIVPP
jgi:hypothetical protein